jgi:hypothetical protein
LAHESSRWGQNGLAFALEDLFEALVALRDFLASVGAGERREEHAGSVARQFELEGQLRPCAAVERFDSDGSVRADRAVDTPKRAPPRGVVLGDLVADIACAAGESACVCCAAADLRRAVGFDADAHDLLLPLAVLGQLVEIREDVLGFAVDLDAVDDRRHLRALLTDVGGTSGDHHIG